MCEPRIHSPDMQQLIDQRHRANTARGELLQLIADGLLTPWEALVAAATAGEKALLRLTLEQLVTAHPGIAQARARPIPTRATAPRSTTDPPTASGPPRLRATRQDLTTRAGA